MVWALSVGGSPIFRARKRSHPCKQMVTMRGHAPGAGSEMMTFSTFLARYGVGGGKPVGSGPEARRQRRWSFSSQSLRASTTSFQIRARALRRLRSRCGSRSSAPGTNSASSQMELDWREVSDTQRQLRPAAEWLPDAVEGGCAHCIGGTAKDKP